MRYKQLVVGHAKENVTDIASCHVTKEANEQHIQTTLRKQFGLQLHEIHHVMGVKFHWSRFILF